jgi:hypothetical protein
MALLLQRILSMSAEAYPDEITAGSSSDKSAGEKTLTLRFLGALGQDPVMKARFNRLRLDKKD